MPKVTTVKDLKEYLGQFPEDMEVMKFWDEGCCFFEIKELKESVRPTKVFEVSKATQQGKFYIRWQEDDFIPSSYNKTGNEKTILGI